MGNIEPNEEQKIVKEPEMNNMNMNNNFDNGNMENVKA